jgi:hypothetical protein
MADALPGVLGPDRRPERGRQAVLAPSDCVAAESDADALLRAVRMETSSADMEIVEYLVDSLDAHGMLAVGDCRE